MSTSRRLFRAPRALLLLALVGGLGAAAAVPAAAAALPGHATTHSAAAAHAVKPAPVPPPGIPVGTTNKPKPSGGGHATIRPLIPWSVTLTANRHVLWPTQFSTLTATANMDVGPTPEFIYILNANTSVVLARCGLGTTCSVAVTSNVPIAYSYRAYISDGSGVNGDNNALAISADTDVDWTGVTMTLTATAYTLPVGASSTLTETSSADIGPSPLFVELWDTTTGTLLATCGEGTTCQATVSQSVATTHSYVATLSPFSASYPPPRWCSPPGPTGSPGATSG